VYEGRIQPDEFIDWLNMVERVFEYQYVPEKENVKIVAIKLKKYTSIWWEQLKMKRAREGKQKIKTWEKMVKELRKKFLPEGYLQEAYLQLHGFVQGDKTMVDYTEELDHLMLKCGIVEPEEQTIARYLCGLHKEIHDVVILQPFISYHDVFKVVTKVEKQLKEKEVRKIASLGGSRVLNRGYPTSCVSSTQSAKPTSSEVAKFPAKTATAGPSKPAPKVVQCYRCKGYGHMMSECPNQRVFTIIEEPLEEEQAYFDSPPIFDEAADEEDVIYGDTGERLVIRRVLNSSPVQDDVWLRNNIFHTRCTSHGKVCDVIIDSGSYENVISEIMVQKLPLKTEKHQKPYKLS
jgi:Retrotransposon gag protein/Zinc knuckle